AGRENPLPGPVLSVRQRSLSDLAKVEGGVVDLNTLKAANIIGIQIEFAKVILAGEVTTPVTVRGLRVTKGARAAIEAAGGKIEE
ncbi:uL15 family ribosomal protein, partial [Salmonella sp. 741265096_HSA]|uniref:uL15 family ribosomal protein n=1 Tax=Salmonella sp. 741265096_HSA TaxID=3389019 RepID=UPI0039812F55